MSTLELKKKGAEYFNSLDDKTKQLIINVMHSTIDMCNELNAEDKNIPIMFYEGAAYWAFRMEMLGHMLNNEFYNVRTNQWEPYEDKTS